MKPINPMQEQCNIDIYKTKKRFSLLTDRQKNNYLQVFVSNLIKFSDSNSEGKGDLNSIQIEAYKGTYDSFWTIYIHGIQNFMLDAVIQLFNDTPLRADFIKSRITIL